MAARLNKKILCFVDEYGTVRAGCLYLGAVLVYARDAGRLDKCFSDCLEPNAKEIHASDLGDVYLQSLMARFAKACAPINAVFVNDKHGHRDGSPSVLYAQALVKTVKVGMKRFRVDVLGREMIGNVEVIVDVNHHNERPDFNAAIACARRESGAFRGVTRVSCIDSAASRLLQLADIVPYSRKWVKSQELNAVRLRESYRIQVL